VHLLELIRPHDLPLAASVLTPLPALVSADPWFGGAHHPSLTINSSSALMVDKPC